MSNVWPVVWKIKSGNVNEDKWITAQRNDDLSLGFRIKCRNNIIYIIIKSLFKCDLLFPTEEKYCNIRLHWSALHVVYYTGCRLYSAQYIPSSWKCSQAHAWRVRVYGGAKWSAFKPTLTETHTHTCTKLGSVAMETLTEETASSKPSDPQLITSANTPSIQTLQKECGDRSKQQYRGLELALRFHTV